MAQRHTFIRSLHDVGGAAWFGGALMGAVALNGATREISDPRERAVIAADGWARWAPVSAVAIAAHLAGGVGLIVHNRGRIVAQQGTTANTVAKSALTVAALATTAYSGLLGTKILAAGRVPAKSGVSPSDETPADVAKAQRQLAPLQWLTPALTAGLVVLGAQQGEQQRLSQVVVGKARKALRS